MFVNSLDEFRVVEPDFVLSNYAFSELTRTNQDKYLKKVILNSPRGYITWNNLSPNGYSLAELISVIPGSQTVPENPLTAEDNTIIVWGHSKKVANRLFRANS